MAHEGLDILVLQRLNHLREEELGGAEGRTHLMAHGRIEVLYLLLLHILFLPHLGKDLRSDFLGRIAEEDDYGRLSQVPLMLHFDGKEPILEVVEVEVFCLAHLKRRTLPPALVKKLVNEFRIWFGVFALEKYDLFD